ncbi:hypothetical protein LWI29_002421 [Acer saccharum]|uniref:Uncharacterized protein n=1 Tax=Acer saccharum TaxID=4024 RepID=A0AA39T223_ACESA|nr:hypothetical protein LWI29_002421 [Acer saccharum]
MSSIGDCFGWSWCRGLSDYLRGIMGGVWCGRLGGILGVDRCIRLGELSGDRCSRLGRILGGDKCSRLGDWGGDEEGCIGGLAVCVVDGDGAAILARESGSVICQGISCTVGGDGEWTWETGIVTDEDS